jgi:hypothetical protein
MLALYVMNELVFSTILAVLLLTHAVFATISLFFIFRKIEELRKASKSKKSVQMQKVLGDHIWLVVLLPIAGPIVGYAILKGAVLGVPEHGLKINAPSGSDSFTDDC